MNTLQVVLSGAMLGGLYALMAAGVSVTWGVLRVINLAHFGLILLGAYSLVLDFDMIQQGVRNRAPKKYGWTGAFGIMVTVIWLYLEILRMLAIARD